MNHIGLRVWRKHEFVEAKEIFGFGNVKIEKESGPQIIFLFEMCRKE